MIELPPSSVNPGLVMKFRMAVEPLSETVGVLGDADVVRRNEVELPTGTVLTPARRIPPVAALAAAARMQALLMLRFPTIGLFCGRTMPSNPAEPEVFRIRLSQDRGSKTHLICKLAALLKNVRSR